MNLLRYRSARWLLAFGLMMIAMGLAWTARIPLLRGAAALWVVSDPLDRADAIVILGGGLDVRPFAAADLYKSGLARQILIANVKLSPIENLKILPSHTNLIREVLLKLDVPSDAIGTFGESVSNTYEEARALRAWAEATGAKSVIIPTELFPSRRVRWVFSRELGSIGASVSVQSVAPPEYALSDWWRHAQGVIGFQNEVLKYLYYRARY